MDILKYAMTLRARPCSLLLAFCSLMSQTIARSRQLCMMKKIHVSLPDQFELPVNPLFGPVQMLQLGDRGNHKVDKLGDMSHWVMRTFKPSLKCPWFGLALKAALDAKERNGEQYNELRSNSTGMLPCKTCMRCFVLPTAHVCNDLTATATATLCALDCSDSAPSVRPKRSQRKGADQMEDGAAVVW